MVLSHIVWVTKFIINHQIHKFCNGERENGDWGMENSNYSPFSIPEI